MYRTWGKLFGSGRLMSGKHHQVEYHPDMEFRQEVDIGPEEYFAYRIHVQKFDRVGVHVEVLEGNDIDCLVMNEYNYGQYVGGEEFTYLLTGSILDVRTVNYIFVAPEDGLYYFVLDNTSFPEHGAKPHFDVARGHARVLFDVRAHEPLQMVTEQPKRMTGT
jgi:ligand-binding sensor domain-containing protein